MASSLPASLFLLSVVFWQFVSAADQNSIKAEPGQNVFLPCKDTDQGEIIVVEWTRTDLKSGFVLLYRDGRIDLAKQLQSYKDRMDLLVNQIQKGDASLVLKNTTIDDSGTYECRVKQTNQEKKRISTVSLVVAPPPPEPFPVWAILLLVLLVLAAAGVSFYFRHRMRSELKEQQEEKVEVESGEEFVLLPFKKLDELPGDVKVEWKDSRGRTVHVYQNGSDQPGEQKQIYRTRTKMDKNLLKNKDLSLTLTWPTFGDSGIYTCIVSSWIRNFQVMKQVQLKVKVPKVEVESGEESVLLPWRTRESLGGDVKVEWRDSRGRTVHVYQDGSDQHGEQNQIYRTRTKMDENLLKNKDLSLTLRRPTGRDGGTYTCRVYSWKEEKLMEKKVFLQLKFQQVEVEPGAESVLLPCRTRENLDGDVKVEWRDRDNRTVHVYRNGSDQPGEQNQIYRTRTKMDENLLKTKNLSLTLRRPTRRGGGTYTCRVYNRDGDMLMEKQVQLEVKVQQVEVEEGAESVLLPFRVTSDLLGGDRVEWRDSRGRTVHVYQNGSDQPGEQKQFYRTRTKMDENLLKTKDLSLTLSRPTERDAGGYRCKVWRDGKILRRKHFFLKVKVPKVEVEPGVESVLLPCRTTENLDGDVKVEWRDEYDDVVHVYQNGSDQSEEQNQIYRTRTKMDENLLENKDLSLTLKYPADSGLFTCRVYSRDGEILMEKQVQLKVKDQQVEVEEGAESVLLPFTVTCDLLEGATVVWWDCSCRKILVYQKGSDQPVEQNQLYRTKMDKNLENGDVSLTLIRPTERDTGLYECKVWRDRKILRVKWFRLKVKGTVQVQPEDIRTRTSSPAESIPLMADQLV
ncbi:uncharacterized protein LOC111610929 isoform X2 [Xiphophorus maculatus]|uniref:uncharacterized protein LOC111610929 isoform X2 n=1 Tax=Xiphophorus maculatus TaxID=8083 RepID=UPI000C6CF26F|nr:uncharacterized protein LOC111610929 isoform X2 [Xiphophorus maculatus]